MARQKKIADGYKRKNPARRARFLS